MTTNITDFILRTESRFPDKVAVKDAKGQWTFFDLMEAGKKIATRLLEMNLTGKPIAVYMPKSKEAVASFLGINYSGNFYAPLDVKSPQMRVSSILQVLETELVLTDREHFEQLNSFCTVPTILVEDLLGRQNIDETAIETVIESRIDTDPVYTIFTSGSTGTPKGVVVSHRGVIDYIQWAVCTFKIDETAIIGNQAPFYFDNSTLDIYLMYATGATLVIVPEEMYVFPARLIEYLNDHRVNFIFWVPSVLRNIANLNIFASRKPEHLQNILFAGEVMSNKHLNYWRKHLPHCRYANLYGPTEITVDCTYYIVHRDFSDNEPLPIGFPCRNSDVLILNEKQQPAATGEQGELCVRGTSLALGYYNDWEKTSKAFIQNPLNTKYPEPIYCTGDLVYRNELGEIVYVGRKDAQIKHNGYRIELGEIETAVLGTHLVDNCCAAYDFQNRKIVVFYQSGNELLHAEFRKLMLSLIPNYMIPAVYNRVSEMKCNANGKIDRLFYSNQLNQI